MTKNNLTNILLVLLCGLMVAIIYCLTGFEVTVLSCFAFTIFIQIAEKEEK